MLRRVGRVLLLPGSAAATGGRLLIADDAVAVADPEVRDTLQPLIPALAEVVGPAEHLQVSPAGLDSWVEYFNILRGAEVHAALGEWIDRVQPNFGPGIR